jgi:hypothetical protein
VIQTRLTTAPEEPVYHLPTITAGPEDDYMSFSPRPQQPTIAMEIEKTLPDTRGVVPPPGRFPGWALCLHPRQDRLPGRTELTPCYDATITYCPEAFIARLSRFRESDTLDTQPGFHPQKGKVEIPVRYASLVLACGMAKMIALERPELGPLRYLRLDGLIGCLSPRVIAIGTRFQAAG